MNYTTDKVVWKHKVQNEKSKWGQNRIDSHRIDDELTLRRFINQMVPVIKNDILRFAFISDSWRWGYIIKAFSKHTSYHPLTMKVMLLVSAILLATVVTSLPHNEKNHHKESSPLSSSSNTPKMAREKMRNWRPKDRNYHTMVNDGDLCSASGNNNCGMKIN